MKNISGEEKHGYEFEERELNSYPLPAILPCPGNSVFGFVSGFFPFHFTVSQMVWGKSEAYFYFLNFISFSNHQTLQYKSL